MHREGSKPRPHMGPGPMRKSSDSKIRPELRDQELIKELSLMDASISRKGEGHEELREIYVIFITDEDIYGKGLPLYHVERKIKETDEEFNDGAHIIYVNGRYRGEDAIGRLIHDLGCSEPRKMNYRILSEQTGKFKGEQKKKEGGAMSRAVEEWKKEIREEAEMEAAKKAAKTQNLRTAREMLKVGKLSDSEIAMCSFLSLDEVRELRKKQEA